MKVKKQGWIILNICGDNKYAVAPHCFENLEEAKGWWDKAGHLFSGKGAACQIEWEEEV